MNFYPGPNMTRSRYHICENEYPYFITCTIANWLPVFTRPESVQIILDSWNCLKSQAGFKLFGYVILENHLHLIAQAPDLSDVIKNFKSFTAHEIINLLKKESATILLKQLRAAKRQYKIESMYQVWEEGYLPKQIQNNGIMLQKLKYIHDNPVKRGYVDDPVHWRYSSARNYAGLPGLIDVITDWA